MHTMCLREAQNCCTQSLGEYASKRGSSFQEQQLEVWPQKLYKGRKCTTILVKRKQDRFGSDLATLSVGGNEKATFTKSFHYTTQRRVYYRDTLMHTRMIHFLLVDSNMAQDIF